MEQETENNALDVTEDAAEAGRGTDTVLGHLSLGEMVIPRAFLDDPQFLEMLAAKFEQEGANIAEFTVGDPANKINPETGHPEFFFKKFKKLFKKIAPIAVQFIPGIGQVGGALLGAGLGALGGGGLKGAISGGLAGYAGAGGASTLGKALGATGATATGLGGGLLGAAAGGASGGLKGALTGAALGGLGGYANAGGLNDTALGRGFNDLYTSASGALDSVNSGVSDLYNGSALQNTFKSGADALKSVGFNTSETTLDNASPVGGGKSSYGPQLPETQGPNLPNTGASSVQNSNSFISPLASALLGTRANDKAEKALLDQQRANQQLLAPYTGGFSFDAGDLQNDPGYQFNLDEGNRAQDRAQLARGGFFSGNALREARTFGQGLADNTYNSAFNRALQGRQAGLTGALAGAGVNENIGNIRANSATNSGNLLSGALGSLLGGNSFTNTGALRGGFDIQEFLRRNGIGASSYAGA